MRGHNLRSKYVDGAGLRVTRWIGCTVKETITYEVRCLQSSPIKEQRPGFKRNVRPRERKRRQVSARESSSINVPHATQKRDAMEMRGRLLFLVALVASAAACAPPSSRYYRLRVTGVRNPDVAQGVRIGEIKLFLSDGSTGEIHKTIHAASSTVEETLACWGAWTYCYPFAAVDGKVNGLSDRESKY